MRMIALVYCRPINKFNFVTTDIFFVFFLSFVRPWNEKIKTRNKEKKKKKKGRASCCVVSSRFLFNSWGRVFSNFLKYKRQIDISVDLDGLPCYCWPVNRRTIQRIFCFIYLRKQKNCNWFKTINCIHIEVISTIFYSGRISLSRETQQMLLSLLSACNSPSYAIEMTWFLAHKREIVQNHARSTRRD